MRYDNDMNLIEKIYNRFPEFDMVNDHLNDELTYVVFGAFSLYMYDMLILKEEGAIQEKQRAYHTYDAIDWSKVDIDELIERAFAFVDELMSNDDSQINDVVYSSIFWTLQDNPYIDQYAKKYLSRRNFRKYEELS